ncbi:MAG TPA: GNAT family acetyltransferase [candidate division Zixibacteria bacterium]|nr:GNAT family acetyltransferase [candidate division Zixibacteria bacterium]
MEITTYKESDEKEVAELWRIAFSDAPAWNKPEEDIRRKLAIQRELFFVARVDGSLAGTAMAGYDGHRGWVYYVATHPEYRRQGVGQALMEAVEEGLRELGCPKLNLQVRSNNYEAVTFYRRLGYDIEDRVSMSKRL